MASILCQPGVYLDDVIHCSSCDVGWMDDDDMVVRADDPKAFGFRERVHIVLLQLNLLY
jgi:hypothetical protein